MASRPPTEPCIPVWYTAPPLFIPLQTCGSKNRKTGIQPSQAVGLRGLCSICMLKRNRHLVDGSSVCIAYLAQEKGGTAYTVNYAKEHGLTVLNIANMI